MNERSKPKQQSNAKDYSERRGGKKSLLKLEVERQKYE